MLVLSVEANQLVATKYPYDITELRFDGLETLDVTQIQKFKPPFIFTVRRNDQGGKFKGTEEARFDWLLRLCQLHPKYLDLEYDAPNEWFLCIQKQFPDIQIICSYHDLDGKGLSLQAFLDIAQSKPHAMLKYAKYCQTALQGLELFASARQKLKSIKNLSVIAMGENVSFIRVLGPLMGNVFDYACIDKKSATASGQISLSEWHAIYHYPGLNQNTKIYALLGHPVDHSLGHQLHNQYFFEQQRPCVYVKIAIEEPELADFLTLAQTLPFEGFSVTMPLKHMVARLVTHRKSEVINTLVKDNHQWLGFNTDGAGALKALNLSKPSKIIILGFGGAAHGIGQALQKAGHQVTYIYRSLSVLPNWQDDIDGVISTLPPSAWENPHPFFKAVMGRLHSKMWVMDMNYNQYLFFEDFAEKKGCQIISGYQMFLEQAKFQWMHWFDKLIEPPLP